jgi:hypothetical protein
MLRKTEKEAEEINHKSPLAGLFRSHNGRAVYGQVRRAINQYAKYVSRITYKSFDTITYI